LADTSVLEIEQLSQSSFDVLWIDGNVMPDGRLDISLLSGFLPSISDSFDILINQNSSLVPMGEFANVLHGGTLWTTGGEGTFLPSTTFQTVLHLVAKFDFPTAPRYLSLQQSGWWPWWGWLRLPDGGVGVAEFHRNWVRAVALVHRQAFSTGKREERRGGCPTL